MRLCSVLFDFNDTLFHIDRATRILDLVGQDADVQSTDVMAVLEEVRTRSLSIEEMAKGRDLSAAAHRRCWTELFRPFDHFSSGLSERIYADISSPAAWSAYPETVEILEQLHSRGVSIGIVSDIGWDVRTVFSKFGVEALVDAWVLSFEHGFEKPDPRLFHAACAGLGSVPAETLMVGDSVLRDAGAASAGLTALTLPPYSGSGERGLRPVLTMV